MIIRKKVFYILSWQNTSNFMMMITCMIFHIIRFIIIKVYMNKNMLAQFTRIILIIIKFVINSTIAYPTLIPHFVFILFNSLTRFHLSSHCRIKICFTF